MEHRKGEGYDWILMGFGVLVAAVFARESAGMLALSLALVLVLFAGVRLLAWWLAQRERAKLRPSPGPKGSKPNRAGRRPRFFCAYCRCGPGTRDGSGRMPAGRSDRLWNR